jgi:class III poly(R)-hydroxyalkanoic acid synthase PhaE subunit
MRAPFENAEDTVGESPNPDWMAQWQALSSPYVNAWQNLVQRAPAAATTPQEGFEQWARLFASGGGSQGETIERMLDSVKSYSAFMQSMLTTMAGAPDGAATSWSDALRQGFAMSGQNTAMFDHPAARAWREMSAGQGGNGFAQVLGLLNAFRAPPDGGDAIKAVLGLPAFGLLREHQEHYQKTALAWIDYKEQMNRYNALMLDAVQRGFAHFEGKLAEREQPGRQIESLRALYDLWVDAAEEGYAEVALSNEFREVYGALVNAQMRVRSQIQKEVERVSVDFGMPTRSEIDSIGKRLQALRREVRANGAGDTQGAELAALRAEFSTFKAGAKHGRSAAAQPAGVNPVAASAKPVRAKPESGRGSRAAAATKPAARKRVTSKQAASKRATSKRAMSRHAITQAAIPKRNPGSARAAAKSAAAVAPDTFSSRIEKYAKTSLGKPRARPEQIAGAPKKQKEKKSRR